MHHATSAQAPARRPNTTEFKGSFLSPASRANCVGSENSTIHNLESNFWKTNEDLALPSREILQPFV